MDPHGGACGRLLHAGLRPGAGRRGRGRKGARQHRHGRLGGRAHAAAFAGREPRPGPADRSGRRGQGERAPGTGLARAGADGAARAGGPGLGTGRRRDRRPQPGHGHALVHLRLPGDRAHRPRRAGGLGHQPERGFRLVRQRRGPEPQPRDQLGHDVGVAPGDDLAADPDLPRRPRRERADGAAATTTWASTWPTSRAARWSSTRWPASCR